MRNISRRIDTIEKKLSAGRHEGQIRLPPPLVICAPTNSMGKDIDKLGALETWITYQEQLQAQERANAERLKDNPNVLGAIIVIALDVDEEYQARAVTGTKQCLI